VRIQKVLNNNNVVIVREDGQEIIARGKGLGYQKKANDLVNSDLIEKVFVLAEKEYSSFEQMVKRMPAELIHVAEEIINYAEQQLKTSLNDHIHIALTDHLSFAIERFKVGVIVHNKLLPEIRLLYPREYEIGCWASKKITQRLGIIMPEDEAGYIALHIHTAKISQMDMGMTMNVPTMIKEIVGIIEQQLGIDLEKTSMAYQRLLTHMRFALQRLVTGKDVYDIDPDLLDMIRIKCKAEFCCAQVIGRFISQEYEYELPDNELGYIALHIRRICQS
jgi:beta-glucoside operon transcriptional antiterminator